MTDGEMSTTLTIGGNAAGAVEATQETSAGVKGVSATVAAAGGSFKAFGAQAVAAMQETAVATRETAEQVKGLAASIVEMREMLSGVGEALMAAFAVEAVAKFAEGIAKAAETTDHAAVTFGLTTAEIQNMKAQAAGAGVPFESLTTGMMRLDRAFLTAKEGAKAPTEAFKTLGISTTESLSQTQLMQRTLEGFSTLDAGPAKVALAMQLFGKNVQGIGPILGLTKDQMEELNKQTQDYGAVSDEATAKGLALAESMNTGKVANLGLGNVMADAFAPVLKVVVDGMNGLIKAFIQSYNSGGAVKEIMTGLVVAFKVLAEIVAAVGLVIEATFRGIMAVVDAFSGQVAVVVDLVIGGAHNMSDAFNAFGQVARDVLSFNWAAVARDTRNGLALVASDVDAMARKMGQDAARGFKEGGDQIAGIGRDTVNFADWSAKLWGPAAKAPLPKEGTGTTGDDPAKAPKAAKTKAEPDNTMTDLSEEFDKEESAHGDMIRNMQADEIAYWQKVLENAKQYGLTEAQQSQIALKIAKDERAVEVQNIKQSMADKRAAADQEIEKIKETLATRVQADNEAIKSVETSEKDGLISHQQAHDKIVALVADRVRAEDDAAKAIYALRIESDNFIEQHSAAGTAEFIAATRDEQTSWEALEKARAAATLQGNATIAASDAASAAQRLQLWKSNVTGIVDSWSTGIRGMLQGTMTWQQGLLGVWNTMLDQFIANIDKQVVAWILNEHIKTAAAVTGDQLVVASHEAAHAQTASIDFLSTIKQVTNAAIRAAAGAYAALAGIPIIGPALGAAAAVVTFAAVEGLGALASASGGYDIPSGVNPLTQLHQEEMVLPATLANPLRSMLSDTAGDSQSGGQSGGGGGDTHNHTWNISAIDAKGVDTFMRGPGGDAIVKGLIAKSRQGQGPK